MRHLFRSLLLRSLKAVWRFNKREGRERGRERPSFSIVACPLNLYTGLERPHTAHASNISPHRELHSWPQGGLSAENFETRASARETERDTEKEGKKKRERKSESKRNRERDTERVRERREKKKREQREGKRNREREREQKRVKQRERDTERERETILFFRVPATPKAQRVH